MVRLATRRVTIPLWVITWLLGILATTIAWAGIDRLNEENRKATMAEWLRQLDVKIATMDTKIDKRFEKLEGKVDRIYELDSRRGSSQKVP